MEDEGIAPNTYSSSSRCGQKVVPVHYMYIGIESTVATFCSYRLDQLFVCGAIPQSSILWAHLYTTCSSMYKTFRGHKQSLDCLSYDVSQKLSVPFLKSGDDGEGSGMAIVIGAGSNNVVLRFRVVLLRRWEEGLEDTASPQFNSLATSIKQATGCQAVSAIFRDYSAMYILCV